MTERANKPQSKPLSAPQKALRKLGLTRDIDLALHLPLRYEDETQLTPLAEAAQLMQYEPVQFEATVTHQEVNLRPRRQLLVTVQDGGTHCLLRFFNFYPSLTKQLAVGAQVRVRGELRGGFGGLHMLHPVVRAAGTPLAERLTPVYPATAQLAQPYLRKAVLSGLARAALDETIPPECLQNLPGLADWPLQAALQLLHQPPPGTPLHSLQEHEHPAWLRLKAEELLAQQLSQQQARQQRNRLQAPALQRQRDGLVDQLLATLPFQLTRAQQRVTEEIAADLARVQPMHRLLQGDVGSGKTVVAALAACVAMDSGWQCVLMAPTEILAEQHFAKLVDWLAPLLAPRGQCVAWLTGSQKKKERESMLTAIASGQAALVVGTHAVIQQQVQFARLGLAVIDEQHRFGVEQRLALRQKTSEAPPSQGEDSPLGGQRTSHSGEAWGPDVPAAGPPQGEDSPLGGQRTSHSGEAWGPSFFEPHLLMMTATPIPRTLAMSYYADLDVSTLDELPPGRTPVVTRMLPAQRRPDVVARLAPQLAAGRQAYWVCPLIEESEALDLRHATQTHEELSAALPQARVGLLHARLSPADKKTIMAAFAAGDIDLLVATTVIEVGVDVPNASLMVIEHAERFGLSQLHQLRGRVGRGSAASACVLLYQPPEGGRLGETARARLQAMVDTNDGFEIARRDLDIRGPGEFLGARQSGAALLRFADLSEDGELLPWARECAAHMLAQHPHLAQRHTDRWLGAKAEFLKA